MTSRSDALASETVLAGRPEGGPYAPPRTVTALGECDFYHTMEIPGYGLVEGQWDLREGGDAYLGNVELAGKRVLEIGTASGFLCFHMERKGAEVVAFDLSENEEWDIVPYAGTDLEEYARKRREHIRQLNNGWWLAHRAFGSEAKAVYGTVYDIPAGIGEVDVTTFGAVLRHVRDPFLALQRALALTRETVVVTANLSLRYSLPQMAVGRLRPAMLFLPDARIGGPKESWWHLTPDTVKRMLGVLGFRDTKVTYHRQRYRGRARPFYTVVGRRTGPAVR
jgi:Methyltransferase domain